MMFSYSNNQHSDVVGSFNECSNTYDNHEVKTMGKHVHEESQKRLTEKRELK